jgi:hypothetical protein
VRAQRCRCDRGEERRGGVHGSVARCAARALRRAPVDDGATVASGGRYRDVRSATRRRALRRR